MNFTGPGSVSGSPSPPSGVFPLASFSVGDGQDGVPIDGATFLRSATLCGQTIYNKQLLVCREGILFLWNSAVEVMQMRRYNSGGLGGWTFEAGQIFAFGERYNVFMVGDNTTIEV